MTHRKVAVVTGSNKGVGYAMVKRLCREFCGDVYLTARDENRGFAAVKSLNKLGLDPKFYILDVTDNASITKLRNHLQQEYGGLDLLINNAGQAKDQVEETIQINYFGLKNTCEILFPILRPHARVVNLSSSLGQLYRIPGEQLKKLFVSENLTECELSELMNLFVEAHKKNVHERDWGDCPYTISKVGVSALTRIQQRQFLSDSREDIIVNSVHPGFVKTDMNETGLITADEGAEAPLYAALLPENATEPKGAYIWCDKRALDWINESIDRDKLYLELQRDVGVSSS